MNQDMLMSILRNCITGAGAIAAFTGWFSPDQVTKGTATALAYVGPIVAIGSIIWGATVNTDHSLARRGSDARARLTHGGGGGVRPGGTGL